jgi:hypothetical protein
VIVIRLGQCDIRLTKLRIDLRLVSGHGVQIKDMDGDESDGLDECSLLCLLSGMPVINGIFPGICAMDYIGDDPYPNSNTPGLIVDDVSRREHPIFGCQSVRLFP